MASDPIPPVRRGADRHPIAAILRASLAARVVAAGFVTWYAHRIGKPCLFGDTFIYEALARAILDGGPFAVDQSGIPHYALRTPGYPAFLAACHALFGPDLLAVRLVQAALGTLGVYFVYRLVGRAIPDRPSAASIAAGIAAVEPYGVGLGALVLSEGVFVPLMLGGLWGVAALWGRSGGRGLGIAVATGLAHGAAILVRPSWALFVPILLVAWVIGSGRGDRGRSTRDAAVVALTIALVMMPWWARNGRIFGRFVPTAVWVGASLYDGISPEATGASEMGFLQAPGVVDLDESAQDDVLRRRAVEFAREHPGRVARLAVVKAGRFWSPWPNAETLRSPVAGWLSATVTLPIFGLVAAGAWTCRRDARAMVLLVGPLAYFLGLHMVFVSSIRYRIPGMFPAFGLAAVGWSRLMRAGRAPSPNPIDMPRHETQGGADAS